MNCRNCRKNFFFQILDLGIQPLANEYLQSSIAKEKKYPLILVVCKNCWLVQTRHNIKKEQIFKKNYSYFSSYSKSWLEHSKKYTIEMVNFFKKKKFNVLEIACNDGYLLQFFLKKKINCLGVEPTKSTAAVARKKNIPVIGKFFDFTLSSSIKKKIWSLSANNFK